MTFKLMTAIREARTFLFVPGNRPDRFTKAMESATGGGVFDLEDSVPPQDKVSARAVIADVLPRGPAQAQADHPVVGLHPRGD